MEQGGQAVQAPQRSLGPIDATCVVIGAIIGVGIFFTPAKVAALTGSGAAALAAWIIAGFIALCGALAFAELGKRYHASGAQYEVLRDAYGPFPAFLFVFCNATAIQGGAIGVISAICIQNFGVAVRGEAPEGAPLLIASFVLLAGITVANIVGVRWGSKIQNLTVLAKVLTLLLVVGLAAFGGSNAASALEVAETKAGSSLVVGVLAALVPAFFSYGGWQHALWISGEVKDPRRNLPRAIIAGVVLVVLVYVLVNWAYLSLLGIEGVSTSKAIAADAVAKRWPEIGKRFIAGAVGLSALGVLNAQLLSGPRLVYGMARDGRFFATFAGLNPRFGTPLAAILLLAFTGALLVAVGPEGGDKLVTGAVFIDGVFFALTAIAVLLLDRRRAPGAERASMGVKIAAALFFLGELGIVAGAYLDTTTRIASVIGLAWIIGAAVLYFVRFAKRPRTDCCPACGYSLTGLPAKVCPECGATTVVQ